MKTQSAWLITIACFAGYFLFGFVDNLKGAALPGILAGAGFSYADGAALVFVEYAGFVAATLATGFLADILGKRLVVFLAGVLMAAGVLGFASANAFAMYAGTFCLVGAGCGAFELGGAHIVSEVHGENKGRYLNLLSGCHGVGSLLAPLFIGAVAAYGGDWRVSYRSSVILVVAVLALFIVARQPKRQRAKETSGFSRAALIENLKKPRIIAANAAMFCYVGVEIGLATWLVDCLMKDKGKSLAAASMYLSLFFAAIMIGRMIGSFFVDRLGHAKSMLYASLGAAVMIFAGLFGPEWAAPALPLCGVFLSIIFPTMSALVANETSGARGSVLGILYGVGGVGGALVPWLIGMANGWLGVKYGMSVAFLSAVAMGLGAAYLAFGQRQRQDGDSSTNRRATERSVTSAVR